MPNILKEGKNSVSFSLENNNYLYEKLSNTLHLGKDKEISRIQKLAESLTYNPFFESDTLKNKSNKLTESLLLNITESCNLKCGYCIYSGDYDGERTNNSTKMEFETAKKAVDFFIPRAKNKSLIGFYGGEPLNNFELIESIVKYTKNKYPDAAPLFSLTTNFVNADKYLEFIVNEDIYANVSLDGPEEVHNKYRIMKSGKPTFEKIMKNLNLLEQLSPGYISSHIGVNATFKDPEDFSHIVDYFLKNDNYLVIRVGAAEKKGLKERTNGDIDISNSLLDYASLYSSKLVDSEIPPKVLSEIFDGLVKTIFTRSNKKIPEQLMLNGSCYPTERKIFVDTCGKYYMCEKFGGRLSLGNVNSGIDSIKVNKAIDDYTEIRNDYCRNDCWAQRLCAPCIFSAKDPKGNISSEGLSQSCEVSKNNILLGIIIYSNIMKDNKNILNEYLLNKQEGGR